MGWYALRVLVVGTEPATVCDGVRQELGVRPRAGLPRASWRHQSRQRERRPGIVLANGAATGP